MGQNGAAVIVFDILFPEADHNAVTEILDNPQLTTDAKLKSYLTKLKVTFDYDHQLAQTISNYEVVLSELFNTIKAAPSGVLGRPLALNVPDNSSLIQMHSYLGNVPILAHATTLHGFTTAIPDSDGIIRSSPLILQYQNAIYPSLALSTVMAYLLIDKISLKYFNGSLIGIQLENLFLPTDVQGRMLINYRGKAYTVPYISASKILHKNFLPEEISGKIVLIGSSAIGTGDLHSTTLQPAAYPGTEIHASLIASILDNKIIYIPVWIIGFERVLLIILAILLTIISIKFSAFFSLLTSTILFFLILVLSLICQISYGIIFAHPLLLYLQIICLTLVNNCCGYFFETRKRKRLHELYGQYVSSTYIDTMIKHPENQNLAGQTKVMSVLFTDVSNFTSISETLSAQDVSKFLNALFTPLTKIIFDTHGTIDKYVGDLIMAFWNAPLDDDAHAEHAVTAALLIQKKLTELNFTAMKLPKIGMRVGINTGLMHVGDMGSCYRKAYTVLGDNVNLASRLEGVNKLYGTNILVTKATEERCEQIIFRNIDRVCVKGKEQSTEIYEPIGFKKDFATNFKLQTELELYEKAHRAYTARDWQNALDLFQKLLELSPQSILYQLYSTRLKNYLTIPPAPNEELIQYISNK